MCWELLEKMREIGKSAGLGCVALCCSRLCSGGLRTLFLEQVPFCLRLQSLGLQLRQSFPATAGLHHLCVWLVHCACRVLVLVPLGQPT